MPEEDAPGVISGVDGARLGSDLFRGNLAKISGGERLNSSVESVLLGLMRGLLAGAGTISSSGTDGGRPGRGYPIGTTSLDADLDLAFALGALLADAGIISSSGADGERLGGE